ncbi:hypothetical protein MESS2_540012 [Mesorhizobium metallidurans STM 2683]|uniref:Uncharacterized protein n=1 Tax=Mesorhizobium metallidurans STM 2683 TaxID=1297569 RepID=M5ETP1_9HYPH|nr:hypothetical protein MESS2_540012 [Mesorhizobium metallidurans STM 2683]
MIKFLRQSARPEQLKVEEIHKFEIQKHQVFLDQFQRQLFLLESPASLTIPFEYPRRN